MKKIIYLTLLVATYNSFAREEIDVFNVFTNNYALQNIELYNMDDYTRDPNIRTGGSFIFSIGDVIHYVKFPDNDEVINSLESLFQSKPDSVLSYLEGNENDLAVILFLHHHFKIMHSETRLTLVLSLRDEDFSDLNEIQESFGDEFLNNLWLQNKSYAVNFWLTYLKENGHISD